jgi:hypothetical protein
MFRSNVLCGLSHKDTTVELLHVQLPYTNLKPGTKMYVKESWFLQISGYLFSVLRQ